MHQTILRGFQLSREHGCYMWGLSNSSNKFFMRETYSVGWCFFQVGLLVYGCVGGKVRQQDWRPRESTSALPYKAGQISEQQETSYDATRQARSDI
jgi:hypothetical protein